MRFFRKIFATVAIGASVSLGAYGGTLYAGAASATIVPPLGTIVHPQWSVWPGTWTNFVTGDSLKATALVITGGDEKVAIVSVDTTLIYSYQVSYVRSQILANTGITRLLIVATHDHSALNPYANMTAIEDAIVNAIVSANSNLAPARIGFGKGSFLSTFNRIVRLSPPLTTSNIVNFTHCSSTGSPLESHSAYLAAHPLDPTDSEVGVVHIENLNSQTIATLVNYTAHAVTYGPHPSSGVDNEIPSSDYPGKMKRDVEASLGGEALFLQGAAGDIDPWCSLMTGQPALDAVNNMGGGLAAEVVNVVSNISSYSANEDVVLTQAFLPSTPVPGCPSLPISRLEINTLKIGNDIGFATFPGEAYVQYGKTIKTANDIGNNSNITFVMGYTNDAVGYIPEKKYCNTGSTAYTTHTEDNIMCVPCDAGDRMTENLNSMLVSGRPLPGSKALSSAEKILLLLRK